MHWYNETWHTDTLSQPHVQLFMSLVHSVALWFHPTVMLTLILVLVTSHIIFELRCFAKHHILGVFAPSHLFWAEAMA